MKTINYILIVTFTLAFASSCENFDTLNTNPDVPTSVSPDLLATQVLRSTFRFWNPNPTDWGTAQLFAKHCTNVSAGGNPYQYYGSYWPFGGFGWYQNLTSTKRMVEFANGNPALPSYEGLALFLKAYWGYYTTLDMGDIPYSEAGKAEEGISQPKYDKQAAVFEGILADLKAAELKFAVGVNFSGDIMLGGNAVRWRRLCNAFQLKVIQTISKKVTPAQKTRFAEIVAAGNLMADNANNFQLGYIDNANASHPFWNGENQRLTLAVSKLMVDALKNVKDRRLFYFAEPAASKIAGGLLENDFAAYEGAPSELPPNTLDLNRAAGRYSLVNKRYTIPRAGDPMLILTYGEQCFIIAEAIEEGWVSGNAQSYYENGVKAMLDYYRTLPSSLPANLHGMPIDQAYIDNYFTGEAAYKVAGTKIDRLQQIWMQRYFIDFFQGNSSGYRNFLRTGYPNFVLDPATSLNTDDPKVFPKRWKYPTDELTKNPENYKKAIDEQFGGFDGVNKVPWWIQ
jgi:hypothetical protein